MPHQFRTRTQHYGQSLSPGGSMNTDATVTDRSKTVLLTDSPAAKDAFGTHDRIAAAIAKLIKSERGGRAIGLQGPYGSGKSTLVNFLRSHLADDDTTHVWMYDAWAHEGDPLRRSFLESLINSLSHWITQVEIWETHLEELGKRKKKSVVKSSYRLSKLGRAYAVSAGFVPVGLLLVAAALRRGLTISLAAPVNGQAVIGLLLTFLPFFVGLVYAAYAGWIRRTSAPDGQEGSSNDERPSGFRWSSLFSVFEEQRVTQTLSTTTETPEPTSLEFNTIFQQLMQHVLQSHDRRLVLVVDNLDRVPGDETLALWSTLRTFLQDRTPTPPWFSKIWVVVPYDRAALSKVWSQNDSQIGEVAASFLDKTFEVIFDVPPPILANWYSYFLTGLREALPEYSEADYHRVFRIYSLERRLLDRPPAPREMKVFINQLGARNRIFGGTLELAILAYHVILTQHNVNVVVELREGSVPSDSFRPLLPSKPAVKLAAVEFGTTTEQAQQLLLEAPILTALQERNTEDLQKLAELGEPFWSVLEEAVEHAIFTWRSANDPSILSAAVTLDESGLLDQAVKHRSDLLLRELIGAARQVKRWSPFKDLIGDGLAALVRHEEGNTALARSLYRSFAASVLVLEYGGEEPAAHVVRATRTLYKCYSDLQMGSIFDAGIRISDGASALSRIMAHVNNESTLREDSLALVFDSNEEDSDVVVGLTGAASGGKFTIPYYETLRALTYRRTDADWQPVLSAVEARLRFNSGTGPIEINALMASLVHLAALLKKSGDIATLVNQGHIAHQLAIAANNKEVEAIAWCLFVLLDHNATLVMKQNVGQAAAGYALANRLCTGPNGDVAESLALILHNLGRGDLLFSVVSAKPEAEPLCKAVFRHLTSEIGDWSFLDLSDVLTQWALINSWGSGSDCVRAVGSGAELLDMLREHGFEEDLATLYSLLIEKGSPTKHDTRQWLRGELEDTDMQTWRMYIDSRSPVLALAVRVAEGAGGGFLSSPCREAIEGYARSIIAADKSADDAAFDPIFVSVLDEDNAKVLSDQIWDMSLDAEGVLSPPFLAAFGDLLREDERLQSGYHGVKRLILPLVETQNISGLKWLDSSLHEDPMLLGHMTQPYRRILREKIDEVLGATDNEECRDLLESVKAALDRIEN